MTLLKNYDLANLVRFLPLVVLLEIVRVASPLSEEPVTSIAKLRALLWCLTNFKGIWRKRLIVQSRMRTVPDSEITRYMLKPNFSLLMRTLGRPPPLS
jgi:isoprenylcysteine carboxyl methyltransferase (ICMT) family protein YpbQ